MDDANNKNDGKKLSGIQKYGRKIRERDRDMVYSRPALRENAENFEESGHGENKKVLRSKKKTADESSAKYEEISIEAGESEEALNDSEQLKVVKLKQKKKKQPVPRKRAKLVLEKEKTRKEKRDSRFSTHGRPVIFGIFFVLLIFVMVFSALLSYTYLVDRTENPLYADEIELDEETTVKFKIEKGMKTKQIVAKLEEMGLIKNSFMFSLLSKFNGYDSEYKSGVHYLSKGLTYDEIMTILSSDPLVTKVTLPEGFTTVQIAERLEANNVCKASEFLKAVNTVDVSSYSFLPKEKGDRDYILDGYLFPDTYEFEIDSSPDTVIYKLLNRFNNIFKTEYMVRAEEKLGLSVDQVVILASIVEKEALLDNEREIIAGVYYNRLRNVEEYGYMQSDATVIYALRRHGVITQTVSAEERAVDDIYNTYLNPGLTPGPICNPSEASLKAVITMNRHDYYFYVLKNDGSGQHIFSRTLEEHNEAIKSMSGD